MTIVAPTVAEWLKSVAVFAEDVFSSAKRSFGDAAAEGEVVSPFALYIDALLQAQRDLILLKEPLAIETLRLPGALHNLVGTARTLVADSAGYRGGAAVFVLGAAEQDDGTSLLTVLRKMGS